MHLMLKAIILLGFGISCMAFNFTDISIRPDYNHLMEDECVRVKCTVLDSENELMGNNKDEYSIHMPPNSDVVEEKFLDEFSSNMLGMLRARKAFVEYLKQLFNTESKLYKHYGHEVGKPIEAEKFDIKIRESVMMPNHKYKLVAVVCDQECGNQL
ncbi:hypothetical protein M3Y97_00713200 [Aphelenchoides bicaudatus]|nr:hypothetical protein M3Y97_00713200 [Aphelenchoides bicaudatus]